MTVTPITTPTSAFAWRPDQVSTFNASDMIPEALLPVASTIAGVIEGDEPAIRVPYVSTDPTTGFIAEGAEITGSDPTLDEVVVNTRKLAALVRVSRESIAAGVSTAALFDSFTRALTRSANAAFLANPVTAGEPTGLLNLTGIVDGGPLGGGAADSLVNAVAAIEGNNGKATTLIASPSAWAAVRNLKATSSGGVPLIGDLVSNSGTGTTLLGCQVFVSNQMTADEMLMFDRTSVVSAWSGVQIASSTDVFFTSDSIAIRAVVRLGWAAVHANRIVKISTGA